MSYLSILVEHLQRANNLNLQFLFLFRRDSMDAARLSNLTHAQLRIESTCRSSPFRFYLCFKSWF
jgi:hypothetical protein